MSALTFHYLWLGILALATTTWAVQCNCGLFTPTQRKASSINTLYNVCENNPSCNCQTRLDSCLDQCAQQILSPRMSSKTSKWQRNACQVENRLITPPGESMMAAVFIPMDDGCDDAKQYRPLPTLPLCCRGSYGKFVFDTMCSWENDISTRSFRWFWPTDNKVKRS